MIKHINGVFILDTKNTTYAFRITDIGYPEHLYYGKKIRLCDDVSGKVMTDALTEKHEFVPGNNNVYDNDNSNFTLNDIRLELSSQGKGDNREPFLEVVHEDGSRTSDFVFESFEITDEKPTLETLPSSFDDRREACSLVVTFADRSYDLAVRLYYHVFEDCDVITRSARLINRGKENVRILRFMSVQIDDYDSDYIFTTFNGAWIREMGRYDHELNRGTVINGSNAGTSSSTANPFVMLSKKCTNENEGLAYGFNLIYSGNHMELAQVSEFGKLRLLCGINPKGFEYILAGGESFEAPEAVMTVSTKGFNGMSHNMHTFIEDHILRGKWASAQRPVLLNSWEAAYFDINESKLLKMARKAKDVGIELFVMDDGWFGHRDDDKSSLGDWHANTKKLPQGVRGLSDKIHDLGLKFGIWVEPEMISEDSDLYRAHPDWAMRIKDKPHSPGRNQMILDLANPDVCTYITDVLSDLFAGGGIDYVKWDMNRTMTDVFSPYLPADRQGETAHRYMLGLYGILDKLTKDHPDILFEGCASGGNRFDLGMLCFFSQIWGSDDTDAVERVSIQTGYSYGYPPRTVSAHVSSVPNHQTLRMTPLETRYDVAAFGSLGYECNLCDLDQQTLAAIKDQISLYKKWRSVFQTGRFYRGEDIYKGNTVTWNVVSPDGSRSAALLFEKLATVNDQRGKLKVHGLEAGSKYRFYNRPFNIDIRVFGDLINTISPIHVKNGSVVHDIISKIVKLDGEKEDVIVYGDTLSEAGILLSPKFSSTGFNERTRVFPDFASRLYFIEKI
ncbi:MAG: alpha-galactosidase [Lachnospiraceae bacterium]|nr:alpha-galactosidase [Lachnospiraceae bacterium]